MLIAVVLGNRMNDDGTITEIMRKRLQLAVNINKQLAPEKIILSGGVANPKAGKSEASAMFKFLCESGVPQDKLVQEDKSLTTEENAKFSVPLAVQLGATELLVCTSPEHMHRSFLNPVRLFKRQIKKHGGLTLLTCCCNEEIAKLVQK